MVLRPKWGKDGKSSRRTEEFVDVATCEGRPGQSLNRKCLVATMKPRLSRQKRVFWSRQRMITNELFAFVHKGSRRDEWCKLIRLGTASSLSGAEA